MKTRNLLFILSIFVFAACGNQPVGGEQNADGTFTVSGGIKYQDAEICAKATGSEEEICGGVVIEDEETQFGYKYEIDLPAGTYFMYATRPSATNSRGAYTEFVECGLDIQRCFNHLPIQVFVDENLGYSGEKSPDIYDWDFFFADNPDFSLMVDDRLLFVEPSEEGGYRIQNFGDTEDGIVRAGDYVVRIYKSDLDTLAAKYQRLTEEEMYLGQPVTLTTLRNEDDPNGPGTGIYLNNTGWAIELDGESSSSLINARAMLQTSFVSKNYGSRCIVMPEPGHCEEVMMSSFFNPASGTCRDTVYTGCGGIRPFEDNRACEVVCEYIPGARERQLERQ